MNLKEKITLEWVCMKTLLSKRKVPVIVSWSITERCNLRCKYCNVWNTQSPELKTYQVLGIIKTLFKEGTRAIRFTGGEPLLREDIHEIINYAYNLGIFTTISTNGILFPEKIEKMKRLNSVSISLDGTRDIHDSIRGNGSYEKALEALEAAKGKNISVFISTTLNSLNLHCIEYLLKIAEIHNAKIFFQPAAKLILYSQEPNLFSPDVKQYRSAILSLIRLKRKITLIGNSVAGLKYLYNWPDKININCVAGKVICRLDHRGNISPCSRFIIKDNNLNIFDKDIKYCFSRLYSPNCGYCWCSSVVELNLISKFNLDAIINAIEIK